MQEFVRSILGKIGVALLLLQLVSGIAIAGDLTITVRDTDGNTVTDAVVTLAAKNAGEAEIKSDNPPYRINQKDTAYDPLVSIVPRGAPIEFTNSDSWGHHVFSFSKARRFDITVPAKTTSKAIVFDKPGVVVIGCNIHDRMLAYIFVNGAGIPVKSDKTGIARFLDVAGGDYVASVWHPLLKSKRKTPTLNVNLNKDGVNQKEITIRLKRKSKKKRKRSRY